MDQEVMIKGKILSIGLSLFLLLLTSATARAGLYISGGLGLTSHDFIDVGDAGGYAVAIGYRPAYGPLGFEASYLDAGSAPISGGGSLAMSGTSVSAVWWIQNRDPGTQYMSGYMKLGLYDMTATDTPFTTNDTGWRFGVGFEFKASRNLAIYTDVDGYGLVDTPGGLDNVTIWSAGLRYYLTRHRAP
jgi:hypothetical protein